MSQKRRILTAICICGCVCIIALTSFLPQNATEMRLREEIQLSHEVGILTHGRSPVRSLHVAVGGLIIESNRGFSQLDSHGRVNKRLIGAEWPLSRLTWSPEREQWIGLCAESPEACFGTFRLFDASLNPAGRISGEYWMNSVVVPLDKKYFLIRPSTETVAKIAPRIVAAEGDEAVDSEMSVACDGSHVMKLEVDGCVLVLFISELADCIDGWVMRSSGVLEHVGKFSSPKGHSVLDECLATHAGCVEVAAAGHGEWLSLMRKWENSTQTERAYLICYRVSRSTVAGDQFTISVRWARELPTGLQDDLYARSRISVDQIGQFVAVNCSDSVNVLSLKDGVSMSRIETVTAGASCFFPTSGTSPPQLLIADRMNLLRFEIGK